MSWVNLASLFSSDETGGASHQKIVNDSFETTQPRHCKLSLWGGHTVVDVDEVVLRYFYMATMILGVRHRLLHFDTLLVSPSAAPGRFTSPVLWKHTCK